MSRTLKFIGFLFAILLTGCTSDAPHDNPLDPANGIHITGRVERLYSTAPLSGATLTLKPGNRIARSTMDGTYQIENISPGNYTLLCSAEGFLTDSVTLTLNRSDTTIFKLNALPYLNHISLTTQHISNSFPADDDFFVQSTAVAGDPDNTSDVELVRYEIDGFAFADTLTLIDISAQGKTFTAELQPGELGLMSLEQLIGKPFNFYVEDLPGAVVREPEQFIIRIIDEVPTTLAPQGNSVNPPFQFEWEPMNLPFSFTYKIEIFQENFTFSELITEVNDIPPERTSITFNNNGNILKENTQYFWVLHIVDEFGNQSRSIKNPFTIN